MPSIVQVAHEVGQRVGDFLTSPLSSSVCFALGHQFDLLPSLLARSRSMRGKRLNTVDIGIIWIYMTASCRSRVLRSRSVNPATGCW